MNGFSRDEIEQRLHEEQDLIEGLCVTSLAKNEGGVLLHRTAGGVLRRAEVVAEGVVPYGYIYCHLLDADGTCPAKDCDYEEETELCP